MRRRNRMPGVLGVAVLATVLLGCGTKHQAQTEDPQRASLTELGQAYNLYLDAKKQPPSRPTDLKPYTVGFNYLAETLQGDRYTVLWGANPTKVADPPNTVLAYEKEAPTNGGWVLMADGSVKKLTPQEFQAAPKAKA